MELYKLPFYQKAKFKLNMALFYILGLFFSLFILSAYFFSDILGSGALPNLLGMLAILFTLFYGYVVIGVFVLRKFFLELTPTGLRVSVPFRKLNADWDEISKVYVQRSLSKAYIAILLKKDVGRKHSFLIPSIYFGNIDPDAMANTMHRLARNKAKRTLR